MIFSSLQYLIFLPIVVFLYWRLSGKARLWLVIAASYFFYMSWLPVYGLLLFGLTCANWLLGLLIAGARATSRTYARALLTLGLLINLGCLCYYKYTGFLLENIAGLSNLTRSAFAAVGFTTAADLMPAFEAPVLNILLPLGISFFVFEFIHYLVDIYRGDKPIRPWPEFAAFAAFFPSQIAGPIKRYQDFMGKLLKPSPWSRAQFNEGMTLIVQGLFKKVAIADPIGFIVQVGYTSGSVLSTADAMIVSIGFVIQVYCDFSGYTDMGRGSALLMGIRLPKNFDLPYLSHDLADFWRRWHMTLSYWLRDYVYIPLGGSRNHRLVIWRNLFITMTVCGLWHGAAWHYVIFGSLQGVGLIVHREWKNLLKAAAPLARVLDNAPSRWFGTFLTMAFITFTFIVFRAPDMMHAWYVTAGLFNFGEPATLWESLSRSGILKLLTIYSLYWLGTELLKRKPALPSFIWSPDSGFTQPVRAASWTAAALLIIAARPTEATPFVYFQF